MLSVRLLVGDNRVGAGDKGVILCDSSVRVESQHGYKGEIWE